MYSILSCALVVAGTLGCLSTNRNSIRDAAVRANHAIATRDIRQLSMFVVRDDGAPCSEEELQELIIRDGPAIRARLAQTIRATPQGRTRYDYRLSDQRLVSVIQASSRLSLYTVPQAASCPTRVESALQLLRSDISRMNRVDRVGSDVAPDYLSQRARGQWNFDVETWIVGLSSPSELEIEEVGKTAIAYLPTGRIVELSFEQGCWRIEALR